MTQPLKDCQDETINPYRVLLVRDGKNDADWLRARQQNGIGASESPIICGMSPYGSIVKLYGQKLGLIEPDDENEAMKWGKLLEKVILEEYANETGRRVGAHVVLLQSIENPFMLATPDGEQSAEDRDDSGLVQVKNTALASDWKEGVPQRVWVQMQHEMAVSGHTWSTAVALLNGSKLVWIDIERDDRFINDTLVPRCREFWNRVINHEGIPPHWIDGSQDTFDALKAMFPEKLVGATVELGPELIEVHERMQEMKTLVSTADREVKTMENRFRLAIGEHSFGRFASGLTYSYKTQQRAGFTVEPTEFRVLRLMKGTVN